MAGDDCVRKRQSGSTATCKTPENGEKERRPENERSFQNSSNGETQWLSTGCISGMWSPLGCPFYSWLCLFAPSFLFFCLWEGWRCSSPCPSCTPPAGVGCLGCCPAELSLRSCALQCFQGSKTVINCHGRKRFINAVNGAKASWQHFWVILVNAFSGTLSLSSFTTFKYVTSQDGSK